MAFIFLLEDSYGHGQFNRKFELIRSKVSSGKYGEVLMPRRQLSLASMFMGVWILGVGLAVAKVGVLPLLLFAVPLVLITVVACSRAIGSHLRSIALLWLALATLLNTLGATLVVLCRGIPDDPYTWLCIAGPFLWSAALTAIVGGKVVSFSLAPVAFFCYICLCPGFVVRDLANGDVGFIQRPHLVFFRTGPNSRLIKRLRGRRPRQIFVQSVQGAYRDGEERVDNRSLVFDPTLNSCLEMLPSGSARRQVLGSLCDRRNYARVHQGMLLTCLRIKGYPQEHSSASWWKQHAQIFVPRRDPADAADLVQGWSERIGRLLASCETHHRRQLRRQLSAAELYERGASSDDAFGEAFVRQRYSMLRVTCAGAMSRVAWWQGKRGLCLGR